MYTTAVNYRGTEMYSCIWIKAVMLDGVVRDLRTCSVGQENRENSAEMC